MNQLFSVGKSLFKNKKGNDHDEGGSSDGMNPIAMFKQLDRNGDGKITEDGRFIYFLAFKLTKILY